MVTEHMLSTSDNPYNPFTQYDAWYSFDTKAGYCSNSLVARLSRNSDDLSEADQERIEEEVIDEIIRDFVTNSEASYIKVPNPLG